MDEVTAGFVGVLVGALVSTLIPAVVEAIKAISGSRKRRFEERREVVKSLIQTAIGFDYEVRRTNNAESQDVASAVRDSLTTWALLTPRASFHDEVVELMFMHGQLTEADVKIVRKVFRPVLSAWAIGEMSERDAHVKLTDALEEGRKARNVS